MPPLANYLAFQKPSGHDCSSSRFGLRAQHPSSHTLGVAIVWYSRFFKDSLLQGNSLCYVQLKFSLIHFFDVSKAS